MTGAWNPEFWNGIGVVGIVVIIGALLLLSLQRGWLVLGIYHRESIAGWKRENDQLIALSNKYAEANLTLSRTLTETNANNDATTRILSALRETIASSQ